MCVVIGTRSEAIRLAPVIHELGRYRDSVRCVVAVASTTYAPLARILREFGVSHDVDLRLSARRQSSADEIARALTVFSSTFAEQDPDVVLVQGESTAVLAACLAAHYLGIPVGHVGGGVRVASGRRQFPEELNGRFASVIGDLHFAPSELAQKNLVGEGIAADRVLLTGNTVVDATRCLPSVSAFQESRLNAVPWSKRRTVLVALHRHERRGEDIPHIVRAAAELIARYAELHLIVPLTTDTEGRDMVVDELSGLPRVELLEPVCYGDLLEVIRRVEIVVTDSGFVQEESAVLGTALVVVRRATDRPEIIASGCGVVAGTATPSVLECMSRVLDDERLRKSLEDAPHPYGDGLAAARIVQALLSRFPKRAGGAAISEGPALLPPAHAIER